MIKIYYVQYTHVVERTITCAVEADSEEEVIKKAKDCEWIDSDDEFAPEQGLETYNYKIIVEGL